MWILSGGLLCALVLLYYTAKSNGRKQALLEQKDLQINAQAKDMEFILKDIEIMQKQIFQWESFRESVQNRLKGIDVRVISDEQLQPIFKDPTIVVEITDPYSTKLEKGKSTK